MASSGQFKLANKLLSVIEKHPNGINKFDLMDDPRVRVSISTYNTNKRWFETRYANQVKYDRESQCWYPVVSEVCKNG